MPFLLILFILVPLGEIFLLIEIGQVIGALATIALCLLTAGLGAALLRQQGMQTLARARQNLDRGMAPAMELLEGVALLVGGALLLTPGFATDVLGFVCLLPPTRHALVRLALSRLEVQYGPAGPPPGQGPRRGPDQPDVIEGEYERRDDDRGRG